MTSSVSSFANPTEDNPAAFSGERLSVFKVPGITILSRNETNVHEPSKVIHISECKTARLR